MLIDYVDTLKTTRSILRDWKLNEFRLQQHGIEVEEIMTRLTKRTAQIGSTPVSGGGGNKSEDALIAGLQKKMAIEESIRRSREFFEELMPKWKQLSAEEQFILRQRYIEGKGIGAVMEKYHISSSEAYRKCDYALERLAKMLFW